MDIDEIKVQDRAHILLSFYPLTCRRFYWSSVLSHAQFIYLRLLLSLVKVLSQKLLEIDVMCLLLSFYFNLFLPFINVRSLGCQAGSPSDRARGSALYEHRPREVVIIAHEV